MKKSSLTLLITSLALGLGLGPARGADKTETDHLTQRAHEVNRAAKKPDMMKVALHDVSVETGVPLEKVQALHKRYSDEGIAGVLIAGALADETKKSPEHFLDKHASGKSWTAIAREYKVPMEKINDRLDHLEKALTYQQQNAEKPKRHKN